MMEENNNTQEEKETIELKDSWNTFKKFWSEQENTINWGLICFLVFLVMSQNLTLCNNYYQEKLKNNTFLSEVMEYNNEHILLYDYPNYEIDYLTMIPKERKDLNIVKTNTSIVGDTQK